MGLGTVCRYLGVSDHVDIDRKYIEEIKGNKQIFGVGILKLKGIYGPYRVFCGEGQQIRCEVSNNLEEIGGEFQKYGIKP